MSEIETIEALEKRVQFLEKQLLQRVPQITTHHYLLLALVTWHFADKADSDFNRVADEMMASIDDLPNSGVSSESSSRGRAMINSELSEFLALVRLRIQDVRKESGNSGRGGR